MQTVNNTRPMPYEGTPRGDSVEYERIRREYLPLLGDVVFEEVVRCVFAREMRSRRDHGISHGMAPYRVRVAMQAAYDTLRTS